MTDLSSPEHEHTAKIDQAVEYLATTPAQERREPVVPAVCSMFGLTSLEALAAIAEADLRRARAL